MKADSPSVRRFAVSRLHLPEGGILRNQVIEFSTTPDGKVTARYFPLTQELPFTEWRGGDYSWPSVSE